MKKSELYFNVLRLPVDFLMLVAAGVSTYFLRTEILSSFRPVLFEFNLPFYKYFYLVVFVSFLFLASYAVSGLYSLKIRRGLFDELLKILVASSAGIMMIIIYIFLRQELFDSRFLILGGWFFAVIFVFIGRLLVSLLQKYYVIRRNFGVHNVVVVGNDELATAVVEGISSDLSYGYRLLQRTNSPDLDMVRSAKPDEVILTNPNYPEKNVLELVDFCHENHIVFKYIPNIYKTLTANFDIDTIGGLPLIELKRTRLDGWGKVIKRTFDIFVSLLSLIILSPLFAIVAMAIKLDTTGPVFARLKRVSRNREFLLYKFRGMIAYDPDGGAESLKASLAAFNERKDGPLFKMKNDPRITRVGKIIRKYRIDELAQFINILRGEMSLVGPRPHQPDEISLYQKHHKKVLAIKAGATGLAQVSGSSDILFEQEVTLDTYYIENWSLWLDLKVIVKTMLKLLTDKSAV
ncbi:MAG: sugar transferase [Candidatus Yanofskybacteria bacterium]|nr:sugar transferase [Candidatus Yanofskybacteria bacterium]